MLVERYQALQTTARYQCPHWKQVQECYVKISYREKVENEFSCMNTKQAFAHLKKMSGRLDMSIVMKCPFNY